MDADSKVADMLRRSGKPVDNIGINGVPCSSGNIRYNDPLLSQKLIDDRGLPHIRLPHDGNPRSFILRFLPGSVEQDAKIAGIAHERGKGIIVVVNKWDAIEKNDRTMREYENEVRRVLSFMPYAVSRYLV